MNSFLLVLALFVGGQRSTFNYITNCIAAEGQRLVFEYHSTLQVRDLTVNVNGVDYHSATYHVDGLPQRVGYYMTAGRALVRTARGWRWATLNLYNSAYLYAAPRWQPCGQ